MLYFVPSTTHTHTHSEEAVLWEVGEWLRFTWQRAGSSRRCSFPIILSYNYYLFCFNAIAYILHCMFAFTRYSFRSDRHTLRFCSVMILNKHASKWRVTHVLTHILKVLEKALVSVNFHCKALCALCVAAEICWDLEKKKTGITRL